MVDSTVETVGGAASLWFFLLKIKQKKSYHLLNQFVDSAKLLCDEEVFESIRSVLHNNIGNVGSRIRSCKQTNETIAKVRARVKH